MHQFSRDVDFNKLKKEKDRDDHKVERTKEHNDGSSIRYNRNGKKHTSTNN